MRQATHTMLPAAAPHRSSRPRQPSCRSVARGPGVGCPGGLCHTALHMLLLGAPVWLACTTGCQYGNNPNLYETIGLEGPVRTDTRHSPTGNVSPLCSRQLLCSAEASASSLSPPCTALPATSHMPFCCCPAGHALGVCQQPLHLAALPARVQVALAIQGALARQRQTNLWRTENTGALLCGVRLAMPQLIAHNSKSGRSCAGRVKLEYYCPHS